MEEPISECHSCAFRSTLYTSGGGVWRLIISITPPVKSCKASLMRPKPMASYDPQTLQQKFSHSLHSGTPLRPKAAKVGPHTHTKRHGGNFLWSWQAEWLAGACAVHTYVRTSHFMTFLHEANFHPDYCQWHGKLDVSFAFFS